MEKRILKKDRRSIESTLWKAEKCRDQNESNKFTFFGGMSFQGIHFFVNKKQVRKTIKFV